MAANEKETYLALIAAQDLLPADPHPAGPRLCLRDERLQGGCGAVWHAGQDGSGPRTQTVLSQIATAQTLCPHRLMVGYAADTDRLPIYGEIK